MLLLIVVRETDDRLVGDLPEGGDERVTGCLSSTQIAMLGVGRRVANAVHGLMRQHDRVTPVCSALHSHSGSSSSSSSNQRQQCVEEDLDPQQLALLEEPCILVDEQDVAIGAASKRQCHLMRGGSSLLHRAFSVFLFNSAGELLVHRRAHTKITFPGHYTNTCCSHPLHTPRETLEEGALGVRNAAQRRLEFELGIPQEQARPEDFTFLTRIHYASPSDGTWGEHEMDYILFLQKDVALNPNDNEVQDVRYIKREDFEGFLAGLREDGIPVTPWFALVARKFLPLWWENLDALDKFTDHHTIHRMLE